MHEAAAAAVETAREEFERAWCRFVLAGWNLDEALVAEGRQAQKLVVAAMGAACDNEERPRLRHSAGDRVPLHLNESGAVDSWRDRPSSMLFEGTGVGNDPKSNALYSELGQLVRAGRERGLALSGKYVRRALERAAKTTEARKQR